MSSLTRWDPVREMTTLRDAMGQLMEQAVLRPGFGAGLGFTGSVLGQMNVFESGNRYICQVLLPGVKTESIDVTVRQNTLSIKATLPELVSDDVRKEATYLLREIGTGEFSRAISFPKDVDSEAVQAQFEHGVLTLVIPLAQHAQPRRVPINQPTGQTTRQVEASPSASNHVAQAEVPAHS